MFPFLSLLYLFSPFLALRLCGLTRPNPLPTQPSLSYTRAVIFLSFGRRRHCCLAGVGAALFPARRPCSLWPRPPWVFLLKVTTSLFKNSAEKEKTLYPTLWAVISREYRPEGCRRGRGVGIASGGGRVPLGWALPPGRRPRGAPRPAALNMADSGVCGGCRCLRDGGGRRVPGLSGGRRTLCGARAAGFGARGACACGGVRGSLNRGSTSPEAACGLHPSPVVHCCFRGGGRTASLRGLSPAAPTSSGAAPSPPGTRRAARQTATAGAVGYEWSGAGPAPVSCDSCRRRTGS